MIDASQWPKLTGSLHEDATRAASYGRYPGLWEAYQESDFQNSGYAEALVEAYESDAEELGIDLWG